MGTFKAGTIQAILELSSKRFVAGIRKADKSTEEFRGSLEKLSAGLSGIASRAAVAFTGLAAGIGIATKIGSDFQDEIVNVGAVAGVAGTELEKMKRIAVDAGEATKFSATEAAQALFNLASQGVKGADNFKNLLKPALDLAAAAQIDVAFASETVLKTLKAFDLEFSDATRVANIFSAANENSALTAELLAAALKPVAGLAGGLGIEIEEVTGILGVLVSSGLAAEEAGTALRNIFLRLVKPVGKAKKILDDAGLSTKRIGELSKTPTKLLEVLAKANLSVADATEVFGAKAIGAFLKIRTNIPAVEALTKAVTGTDSAARIAAIQLTSFGNQVKLLSSKVQTLAIELFTAFEPALRKIISAVSAVIVKLVEFVRNNKTLIATLALGVTALTGAVAVVAGLGSVLVSTVVSMIAFKVGMAGVAAIFPGFAAGALAAKVAMLGLKFAAVGAAFAIGFQIGKRANEAIKTWLPGLDKAINKVIKRFIGLRDEMEKITGTTLDTADRFDKLASKVENLGRRKGFAKLRQDAKNLGIEVESLPPALLEALQTSKDWSKNAQLIRDHAIRIREATAKVVADQKKITEETKKQGKLFVAGAAAAAPTDLIEISEKKRAEGLKFLDSLREDLATRDMTREQIALQRLDILVATRILKESEVAEARIALEELVREKEREDELERSNALIQQLEAITNLGAGFNRFLTDAIKGNKTLGEAAKELGSTILDSILSALIKAIVKLVIMDGLFKSIAASTSKTGKGIGKTNGGGGKNLGSTIGGLFGPVGSVIGGAVGSILPFAHGGEIPRGEDGVFAAQAGEVILSRKTVSALGGGEAMSAMQESVRNGGAGGGTTIQLTAVLETATGDVPQGTVDRFAEQIIDRLNFRFGAFTGA